MVYRTWDIDYNYSPVMENYHRASRTFLQILGIAGLFVLICLYFGICVTLTFEGDPTIEPVKKPEKKKKELTQEQSVNIARVIFFPITAMVHMGKFQHQRRVNKRKRDIRIIDGFHWYW